MPGFHRCHLRLKASVQELENTIRRYRNSLALHVAFLAHCKLLLFHAVFPLPWSLSDSPYFAVSTSHFQNGVLKARNKMQCGMWVMPAFGQTAFGQHRIGQNRIWPKKSEFGQFVFVTAFGQTAFGQFGCFNVLAKFSVVVVVPGCCCLLLLLLFLVVIVVACCCLLLLVVCWCLLVSVGACWCLLVVVVCVWWVCSRFLGLSPGPPSAGPPFHWTTQNFALGPPGFHRTTREPKRAHLSVPSLQTPPKFHEENHQREKKE